MLDWLSNLWDELSSMLNNVCEAMRTAYEQMNSFQFDGNSVIEKSLGLVKYFLGTPTYYLIITLLIAGVGFMVWTCIKTILDIASKLKSGGLKISRFRGF